LLTLSPRYILAESLIFSLNKANNMKTLLIVLLTALSLFAHANAQNVLSLPSTKFIAMSTKTESSQLITNRYSADNVTHADHQAQGKLEAVAENSANDLAQTVPLNVAAPLLAVAIALFGFGANRRRV
jgi:hypothetical protein